MGSRIYFINRRKYYQSRPPNTARPSVHVTAPKYRRPFLNPKKCLMEKLNLKKLLRAIEELVKLYLLNFTCHVWLQLQQRDLFNIQCTPAPLTAAFSSVRSGIGRADLCVLSVLILYINPPNWNMSIAVSLKN